MSSGIYRMGLALYVDGRVMPEDVTHLHRKTIYYADRLAKYKTDAGELWREQQEALCARGLSKTQRWSARRTSPSFWMAHRYYLEQKLIEAENELARRVKEVLSC